MLYNIGSANSNELEVVPEAGGAVDNIGASFSYTSFVLSWEKSQDPDVQRYLVLYKTDPNSGSYNGIGLTYAGDPGNESSPIIVQVSTLANPDAPSIILNGLVMGVPYWFAVIAINSTHDESSLVEMVGNITPTTFALATVSFAAPSGVTMQYNRVDNSIMFTWQGEQGA